MHGVSWFCLRSTDVRVFDERVWNAPCTNTRTHTHTHRFLNAFVYVVISDSLKANMKHTFCCAPLPIKENEETQYLLTTSADSSAGSPFANYSDEEAESSSIEGGRY